jgi:hypothetical protein
MTRTKVLALARYVLLLSAGTLLVTGCGGSQPPIGPPGAVPQSVTKAAPAVERLFVLNSGLDSGPPSVAVFPRDADGNVAPLRTIAGSNTDMSWPGGIAVDGGRIYVSDSQAGVYGTILVYAARANGNVPPIAQITKGVADPSGVAVDSEGNVYECNFEVGSVNVYAAKTYELTRTITGAGSFSFGYCDGLAVGRSGKLYVLVGTYSGSRPVRHRSSGSYYGSIAVFPAGANGPTMPTKLLEGPRTGLTNPLGIAVDTRGRMFVTNSDQHTQKVLVFAANANGNVEPAYTIQGRRTRLVGPSGIALDRNGALAVTNFSYTGQQSIVEYAAGSRGDVAPARRVKGKKSALQSITYVALK